MAARNEFSGTIPVTRNGTKLFENAYGLASKNFNVPNRMDTKFNLASLSKMFTSVAIAQLAEQGRLGIDDPIGRHMTGFSSDAAEKVTIRHLLRMQSGWGDYWGDEYYRSNFADIRTVSDYISFLRDKPLQFEPGTQDLHSNSSFQILGAIVEAVSGQDYYAYVQENIFDPAGIRSGHAEPHPSRS